MILDTRLLTGIVFMCSVGSLALGLVAMCGHSDIPGVVMKTSWLYGDYSESVDAGMGRSTEVRVKRSVNLWGYVQETSVGQDKGSDKSPSEVFGDGGDVETEEFSEDEVCSTSLGRTDELCGLYRNAGTIKALVTVAFVFTFLNLCLAVALMQRVSAPRKFGSIALATIAWVEYLAAFALFADRCQPREAARFDFAGLEVSLNYIVGPAQVCTIVAFVLMLCGCVAAAMLPLGETAGRAQSAQPGTSGNPVKV